jgi:hypothetical protein
VPIWQHSYGNVVPTFFPFLHLCTYRETVQSTSLTMLIVDPTQLVKSDAAAPPTALLYCHFRRDQNSLEPKEPNKVWLMSSLVLFAERKPKSASHPASKRKPHMVSQV